MSGVVVTDCKAGTKQKNPAHKPDKDFIDLDKFLLDILNTKSGHDMYDQEKLTKVVASFTPKFGLENLTYNPNGKSFTDKYRILFGMKLAHRGWLSVDNEEIVVSASHGNADFPNKKDVMIELADQTNPLASGICNTAIYTNKVWPNKDIAPPDEVVLFLALHDLYSAFKKKYHNRGSINIKLTCYRIHQTKFMEPIGSIEVKRHTNMQFDKACVLNVPQRPEYGDFSQADIRPKYLQTLST